MSVNDAIKDMLYGHEHRWRVAEHDLAQARSEVARLTAERDAAVARNIILYQQKTEEAEAARVDRVPVADYYQRVRKVLEDHGVDEAILDEVRDLPGWDGTEGGYNPGLTTTTFVYREDLDKVSAERDALHAEVEAMLEVVEAARETTTTRAGEMLPVLNRIYLALAALDALRARKVGG